MWKAYFSSDSPNSIWSVKKTFDQKQEERGLRCRSTRGWRSLRRSRGRASTSPWRHPPARRLCRAVRCWWGGGWWWCYVVWRSAVLVVHKVKRKGGCCGGVHIEDIGGSIFWMEMVSSKSNILIRPTWWLTPPTHLTPFVLFYRSLWLKANTLSCFHDFLSAGHQHEDPGAAQRLPWLSFQTRFPEYEDKSRWIQCQQW